MTLGSRLLVESGKTSQFREKRLLAGDEADKLVRKDD